MMLHVNIPSTVWAALAITATIACSEGTPTDPAAPTSNPVADPNAAAIHGTGFSAVDVPVGFVDPGEARFADGKIVIRGLAVLASVDATDPRFTGTGVVTANGVLDAADGSGTVWGSMEIESQLGGTWIGTWRGHREPSGAVWVAELTWQAHGGGGAIDGLHAAGTEIITSVGLVPSGYVGAMQGLIW